MKALDGLLRVVRTALPGYLAGLAAIALATVTIGVVLAVVQIANISMLYLIAVIATAIAFGSGPAVVAAVAAFLTFNWFFVEPLHTFTIADPEEWLALLLLLMTGIITGQLAADQRRRAREARQREREAVILHDVARLMGEPELGQALHVVAERLLAELHLAAVLIEIEDGLLVSAHGEAGEPEALRLAQTGISRPARVLGKGTMPTSRSAGGPGRWIRVVPPHPPSWRQSAGDDLLNIVPVRAGDRRVGVLILVREPEAPVLGLVENRLLSTVAAQLGIVVDKMRLRREATEAEILRRTDELKTALLNAVSHDLRTPLASIIASAGSIRRSDVALSKEDSRELAQGIEEEALRLNQIVSNLLDLSRMEGGSLRPLKDWYDLAALVDDVLGRLAPLTTDHPITVTIPEDLPPVRLDYVEIDQVLSNLIENAVKYSPAGTSIEVSAHRRDNAIEVEVVDRGPGVPPAALSHLFEPFYRADRQCARRKGTGLGLAVAKGIVDAHGGRIWVENRQEGGTRFAFTLPVGPGEGEVPPEAAET